MEKNKGGRPSKLTPNLVDTFRKVVEAEDNIYCTDEELFSLLNDELPRDQQIGYRTFKRWKAGESPEQGELFEQFQHIIRKALIKEKKQLLRRLREEPQGWQRFAWLLERKFEEWNLKSKVAQEISGPEGKPVPMANEHHVVFYDYSGGKKREVRREKQLVKASG